MFLILNLLKGPRQISQFHLLNLTQQWVLSYLLGKDINNFTDWTRIKKGSLEKSFVPECEMVPLFVLTKAFPSSKSSVISDFEKSLKVATKHIWVQVMDLAVGVIILYWYSFISAIVLGSENESYMENLWVADKLLIVFCTEKILSSMLLYLIAC